MLFAEPMGQSWLQIEELALAFLLSALIGLEREFRQKSAGLRTYTLVGLASALIMLVSKYGFTNILENYRIVLDPSRIAAQIVSGIGFIGGGVIFVRKDIVRGLTTASTVWLVAAVGMACGGGLPILAMAVTVGHFIVVTLFPIIERKLPKSRWSPTRLQVSYRDGKGILRDILVVCTQQEFSVSRTMIHRDPHRQDGQRLGKETGKEGAHLEKSNAEEEDPLLQPGAGTGTDGIVTVMFELRGAKSTTKLAARLSEIEGVLSVGTDEYANHFGSD
jgi:putative Mg2+ transporter-C (MgtC) family protein